MMILSDILLSTPRDEPIKRVTNKRRKQLAQNQNILIFLLYNRIVLNIRIYTYLHIQENIFLKNINRVWVATKREIGGNLVGK